MGPHVLHRPLLVVILFLGLIALLLAQAPPRVSAGAAPGKITVQPSTITGQQGKVLLIVAVQPGGGPMARACWNIDSNTFMPGYLSMTDMPGAGGPCDGATSDTVFPAGTYSVQAGVYTGGSETPEKSVTASVQVDGDALLTLDGAPLAPEAVGDANCSSAVDAVDALFVLRRVAGIQPFAQCIAAGNVKCGDELSAVDALFILRFVAALPVTIPQGCPPLLAAPAQISPPDASVFHNFPRTTTLQWNAVPGAAGYIVQVDCLCGQWQSDAGLAYLLSASGANTSFVFDFVGDQDGRWRVWAVDENGRPGARSGWWGFEYQPPE